ncbi:hypothetical protein KY338_02335 [Candidatus Woesearchaeota archaeon]|nr:hypothetical protein [Candidatus Woesearchaeota archaeon]MBW3006128.1 hypothetical protein [Candidatus Woesearchaeota archaeon]
MAGKDIYAAVLLGMSVVIFLVMILMSFIWGNTGFVPDMIAFIILSVFFYFTYEKWNLNLPIYTILILGFIPHALGFMGFYGSTPIGISWDHLTHILPIFAFGLLFFNFLYQWMDRKFFTQKTIFLILVVLMAASGIGVIIELVEFSGFMVYGFGEGALAFGTGDACPGQLVTSVEEIEAYGVGWFNTMYDLVWNSMGALAAVLIMILIHYVILKPRKNLFDRY